MPWFRVEDTFALHPKAIRAGNAALGLWLRAGTWSASQLTDGFVPDAIVSLMGDRKQATSLVNADLWKRDDDEGGYWFHDWDTYQPTREETELKRKQTRDRQARHRNKNRDEDTGRFR